MTKREDRSNSKPRPKAGASIPGVPPPLPKAKSNAGRKSKLDNPTTEKICKYIRAGAFDWVAAEASGIGRSTFSRWMHYGEEAEKNRKQSEYREFRDKVRGARAEARVTAELTVRRDDPFKWLRYGPGRERRGEPGWTDSKELTGPEGEAIQVEHDVSIDKARGVLKVLEEAGIIDLKGGD